MKAWASVILLAGCAAAQNTYLPPRRGGGGGGGGGYRAGGGGNFGVGGGIGSTGSGGGFVGGGGQRQAGIISLINENNGDGTYRYSYETDNGIQAEERGQLQDDGGEGVLRAQGSFAFTAPDNNVRYSVSYTADENGFQPSGDHLPTPPPIPPEILRALQQNAAEEAQGIVDDGQYRPQQHGGGSAGVGVYRGGAGAGDTGAARGLGELAVTSINESPRGLSIPFKCFLNIHSFVRSFIHYVVHDSSQIYLFHVFVALRHVLFRE